MADCGWEACTVEQRRTLRVAFVLNASMFVVEGIAGFALQSSGLLVDALDMLSDASTYAISHAPHITVEIASLHYS